MIPQESTVQLQTETLPWQWLLRQVDAAAYRPVADPHVLAEQVVEGEIICYVLKNRAAGTYLKLEAADYDLWQLMDGLHTVKDLVVAHFVKRKTFAYGRVAALVSELKDNYFLRDKPVGVFQQATQQLAQTDWRYRWQKLAHAFVEYHFPVQGLDAAVGMVYRWGGRVFFNVPAYLLLLVLALVGLYPFSLLLQLPQQFPVIGLREGNYWAGLALLAMANMLVIFGHELAHALATKHYNREVPSGGMMIYYGMPAFYVNTMDIWLEPRLHRIVVSWAGPFSGICLAGAASFVALLADTSLLSQFCFKVAFWGYMGFLVNLNPLLELDGYFILMDALGIPMLRQRALDFIKTDLLNKLKQLKPVSANNNSVQTEANRKPLFTREEMIFAVYGLLSAGYAGYVLWFALYLWNNRLLGLLTLLWAGGGWFSRAVVVVLGGAVLGGAGLALAVTVWQGVNRGYGWLHKRGFFEKERNIALLATVTAILTLAIPQLWSDLPLWGNWLWLAAAGLIAAWSLGSTAWYYEGSAVQPVFWGFTASASLLPVAAVMMALQQPAMAIRAAYLALFPLAVVGISEAAGSDLRRNTRTEYAAMLVLVLTGLVLAMLLARRSLTDFEGFLAGGSIFCLALFLALIIPSLTAYRYTHFMVPLSFITLGSLLLSGFNLTPFAGVLNGWDWLLRGAIVCWMTGGLTYLFAGWRLTFTTPTWEQGLALSEELRLRQAFRRFFAGLFAGFRLAFGDRRAQSVDDDLDVIAVTAGWGVTIDRGRVRDRLNLEKITVLEQANRYQEVLARTIDLMDNWAGSRFMARAAQSAYDALPWPEREALGRYVLAGTPWGAVIARQFAAVRSEQFRLLKSLPIFSGCTMSMLDQILDLARKETVSAGTVLLKEGKPYPHFVLVMSGEIEVWKMERTAGRTLLTGQLQRGATFGSQIFTPQAEGISPATYRSAVPSDLLLIDREAARQLKAQGITPNREATQASVVGQLLTEMPLFAELSSQQIEALLHKMGRLTVEKGKIIIKQGQSRQYFYIIVAGKVGVLATDAEAGSTRQLVAELGPGEHFGETSLYTNQPYSATCVAVTDVQLLTLDEFTFDRLVATSHQIAHYVEQISSGRLKDTRRKLGLK